MQGNRPDLAKVVDEGVRVTYRSLGSTQLVEVNLFAHAPGPHRDPDVETFPRTEIIFTLADRWGIRAGSSSVEADARTVVFGNQGEHYACSHFAAAPQDETLAVGFAGLQADSPLSEWVSRQEQPLFGALALPLSPWLRQYRNALLTEGTQRAPGYRLKLDALCTALLVDSVRALEDAPISGTRRPTATAIADARAFLDEHLGDDLDIAVLAQVAGLSPFHFARLFREHTGLSPHQYVVRARLTEAARLLHDTALPVTDIAFTVGYGDAGAFARAFRLHHGLTPSEFRAAGGRR